MPDVLAAPQERNFIIVLLLQEDEKTMWSVLFVSCHLLTHGRVASLTCLMSEHRVQYILAIKYSTSRCKPVMASILLWSI